MPSVNLLPERLVLTQRHRRHVRRWATASLVSLGVLAVPLSLDWYRNARAGELALEYQSLSREQRQAEKELNELIAQSRETFLQLERAKALRTKRSWSGMLTLLKETMPAGCWLVELATDPPAPAAAARPKPASAASPAGEATAPETIVIDAPRALRITGFAGDPGDPLVFVSRLKATGVFTQVVLERTQREPVADGFYFRFDILCTW